MCIHFMLHEECEETTSCHLLKGALERSDIMHEVVENCNQTITELLEFWSFMLFASFRLCGWALQMCWTFYSFKLFSLPGWGPGSQCSLPVEGACWFGPWLAVRTIPKKEYGGWQEKFLTPPPPYIHIFFSDPPSPSLHTYLWFFASIF